MDLNGERKGQRDIRQRHLGMKRAVGAGAEEGREVLVLLLLMTGDSGGRLRKEEEGLAGVFVFVFVPVLLLER
jgi:hypothetical protein